MSLTLRRAIIDNQVLRRSSLWIQENRLSLALPVQTIFNSREQILPHLRWQEESAEFSVLLIKALFIIFIVASFYILGSVSFSLFHQFWLWFYFLQSEFHVVLLADQELTVFLDITLNSLPSRLYLPNSGVTRVCRHVQLQSSVTQDWLCLSTPSFIFNSQGRIYHWFSSPHFFLAILKS